MGLPKLQTQFDVKNLFNDYEAYASKTPTTRYTLGNMFAPEFEQTSVTMFGEGGNCKLPPLPPFSNDIVLQDLPEDLPSSLPIPATDPLSSTEAEEQQEPEEEVLDIYEDDALDEAPDIVSPSKPEQQNVQEPVVQNSPEKPKQQTISTPTEDVITIKVKPARKTPDFYIDSIPDKVFCAPYKYDFKILFRKPKSSNEDDRKYLSMLREGHEQQLSFVLLDAESRQTKKVNSKGEATLVIERSKAQEEDPEDKKPTVCSHVTFRVCFQTCSFHNHRKPFVMRCFDKKSGLVLFETNKFNIYARKNKEKGDDWAPEGGQKMKILFATSSSFDDIIETEEEPVKAVKAKKGSKRNHKRKKVQEEDDYEEEPVESEEEQEPVEMSPQKKRRLALEEKKKESSFKTIYQQLGSMGQQEESNVLNELESLRSN